MLYQTNLFLSVPLLFSSFLKVLLIGFARCGKGTKFPEYTAPGNLIHLTAMTPAKPSETAKPTYNEDDYESTGSPVALTFEYGLVNDFLSEWCEMKTKLNNGEISPNEYFEWKITWPQA